MSINPQSVDEWRPGAIAEIWAEPDDDAPEDDAGRTDRLDALRARAARILELLTAHDRALLEMHIRGVEQKTIGAVLGKRQSTISYSACRLMQRIRVLSSRPEIPAAELHAYLRTVLTPRQIEVFELMLRDPCHAKIAPKLGLTTGAVRNACLRALDKLRRAAEGFDKHSTPARVYRLFRLTVVNQTLLHTQTRIVPQLAGTIDAPSQRHDTIA